MKPIIAHVIGEHLQSFNSVAGQGPTWADPQRVTGLVLQGLTREQSWNQYFTEYYSTNQKVLVLPIEGPLSRAGYYTPGYEWLAALLNSAAQDDRYVGAVLKTNTGGGTADGAPILAAAVENFPKPILNWTNYCASAGVLVTAHADEQWMEDSSTSQMGSVGTILFYQNYAESLKQQGIKWEIIRAQKSPDKARINPLEELTTEARAELQAMVDAAQKEFEGIVKRGRMGKVKSEALTGKMFGPKDAIAVGLADRTGSLAQAINRVATLAKGTK